MSRVSSKDKYVNIVYKLFREKGLRLTMYEIAQELNVTKKTLYNNFASKDDLMRTVMLHVLSDIDEKVSVALNKGKNAIEALYLTSSMLNKALEEIGPLLMSDSSALLPDLKLLDHSNRRSLFSKLISDNLERGLSEKLYRSDLNKDLVTLFFTSAMAKIYSWNGSYSFLKNPYLFHSELIRYHLEAIVNEEGREMLKSFIKK